MSRVDEEALSEQITGALFVGAGLARPRPKILFIAFTTRLKKFAFFGVTTVTGATHGVIGESGVGDAEGSGDDNLID